MPTVPTITDAAQAVHARDISAAALMSQTLEQLAAWEPHVHAFLEQFSDSAQKQAEKIDKQLAKGTDVGPLAGVPIAIKDNMCTREGHTTAASKILETFTAPYDATVVSRLKKAGAIVIGKTNLDEFAMGSSTEQSAFFPTNNPWDTSRVPGGSSGGSVAAVACGAVPGALGTDTGGSIRQPSSFCSTVGVKPTYGRVSRYGVIAYGSSHDQVGPIARTVADAALLLRVIAGHDERDATSSQQPVPDFTQHLSGDLKGLKVGVPKEFFTEMVDQDINRTVRAAIDQLKSLGATISEVSLPLTDVAIAVYYLIVKAEASTNYARYDALRYAPMELAAETLLERYEEARGKGFGREVKRAILMGTYALSSGYYDAWYKKASQVRTLIRREYEKVFKDVDVLAAPVTPEVAFPLGAKTQDPLAMYMSDVLTVPINVAGVPAISVPCGFVENLPVGLQIIAPAWGEATMLRVAHAYEQSQEWHKKLPTLPK